MDRICAAFDEKLRFFTYEKEDFKYFQNLQKLKDNYNILVKNDKLVLQHKINTLYEDFENNYNFI